MNFKEEVIRFTNSGIHKIYQKDRGKNTCVLISTGEPRRFVVATVKVPSVSFYCLPNSIEDIIIFRRPIKLSRGAVTAVAHCASQSPGVVRQRNPAEPRSVRRQHKIGDESCSGE